MLAIDTSTLVSTLAIGNRDKVIGEISINIDKHHSERLMPNIKNLFEMAMLEKSQIEAIAVSIGPGSFTGLRIGLATAKALAYAWQKPLVAVPTLEAMAYNCRIPNILLVPILDAQKGNVYQAIYKWHENGTLEEVIKTRVIELKTAVEELNLYTESSYLLGEANLIKEDMSDKKAIIMPNNLVQPKATSIMALGYKMLDEGIHHDLMTLEPYYIRKSEAEVLWEKRQRGL